MIVDAEAPNVPEVAAELAPLSDAFMERCALMRWSSARRQPPRAPAPRGSVARMLRCFRGLSGRQGLLLLILCSSFCPSCLPLLCSCRPHMCQHSWRWAISGWSVPARCVSHE